MFCGTLWCHTNAEGMAVLWAAAITAIPATVAVFFAWRLGQRQTKILEGQALFQAAYAERTLEIEHLKVRADLFDQRFKVYQATREWVRFIISEARPPRTGPRASQGEEEIIQNFVSEWDRSRFLFRPSVHAELKTLLERSHRLHYHQMRNGAAQVGDGDGIDHAGAETNILLQFANLSETVSSIFGDELTLTKYEGERPADIAADDPIEN